MLELLLLVALAVPANVITVDDDGPADYPTIVDAVAAAQAGDTVLVSPGDYEAFVLDKDLTLLGPASGPRPRVAGISHVTDEPVFVLSGLEFQGLDIACIGGRGVLDDSRVGSWSTAGADTALSITDIPQLVVSRCGISGWFDHGGRGVQVTHASVDFVSCSIQGGSGHNDILYKGGNGGAGVAIADDCVVRLAGTSAFGGDSGEGGMFSGDGKAGDGLVTEGSTVIARGVSGDWFRSGDWYPGLGMPGVGLRVSSGVLIYSGISYDQLKVGLYGEAMQPAVVEPFVESGNAPPAAQAELSVRGPPGAAGVLLVSASAGNTPFAKLELPLWLPPSGTVAVPVITAGQDAPVVLKADLPPGSLPVGTTLRAQAVFPTLASTLVSGTVVLTAETVIVMRF